ncbi:MAG: right-handed parallel beta-helix repeat-containing protein [Candidatus Zixiibacteriota bacterium]
MRSIAIVICAILILFFFSQVQATIIHVPGDSSTIQGGINGAVNGDTVLVAPGIYYEHINFNGTNLILGTLFLPSGDTSYISNTIIDGDSSGTVITFTNGEDTTAQVAGFTIQNGWAGRGGGIYCRDSSSPTIRNNKITGNAAEQAAGVYCLYGSSPRIRNNTITGNSASVRCGAIQCIYGSNAVIVSNVISNNSATYQAGGIDCNDSDPLIMGNVICNNSTYNGGGIVSIGHSNPTIIRNIISDNYAEGCGGAIGLDESDPLISNNTISGNTADDRGGGVFCNISHPTLTNTILWANSSPDGPQIHLTGGSDATVIYSDVEGGWEGVGNINADPLFCDSEDRNYYLWNISPCLGAGEGGSNIGALSVGCVLGDANSDGIVDIGDVVYLINYLYRDGDPPNPIEAGDCNCDEIVDLGDLVYLINYLYKGGPPPCEP